MDSVDRFQKFTIEVAVYIDTQMKRKGSSENTKEKSRESGLSEQDALFQKSRRFVMLVMSERSTPCETTGPEGRAGAASFPEGFSCSA